MTLFQPLRLAQPYLTTRGGRPTLAQTIERANAWSKALFTAVDEAKLHSELADTPYFAEQLFECHGVDPDDEDVTLSGIRAIEPGTVTSTEAIEQQLGPLPESYRALMQCGALRFLRDWGEREALLSGAAALETLTKLDWLFSRPEQWSRADGPRWAERTTDAEGRPSGAPLRLEEARNHRFVPVLWKDSESLVVWQRT